MIVYCCNCQDKVEAERVCGNVIYPHRPDLSGKEFYQCPMCKGYVGTHDNSGKPLGCIPSPEIKKARMFIHAILDPIYKDKKMSRRKLYKRLAGMCGRKQYHTAWIRTIEEAREVYGHILAIRKEVYNDRANIQRGKAT